MRYQSIYSRPTIPDTKYLTMYKEDYDSVNPA